MPKPHSLALAEIEKRLRKIGFVLTEAPDELLVFSRTVPAYFPYTAGRAKAYHIPRYDANMPLPADVVEDILLHLFLSSDEEEEFWGVETPEGLHVN